MNRFECALLIATPWIAVGLTGCESGSNWAVGPAAATPRAAAEDSRADDPVVDDGDDEADERIALDQVPQAVIDAALAAVPGLVLSGAEKELEAGQVVYSLEGKVGGATYEVEVGADGRVNEIDADDADDDGDDAK
ncbi:MAG: hypothetical protein FJ299_07765 [Planctomycetes bacterium]|nr:hypothetical protein [Planctomycetota bacterium]